MKTTFPDLISITIIKIQLIDSCIFLFICWKRTNYHIICIICTIICYLKLQSGNMYPHSWMWSHSKSVEWIHTCKKPVTGQTGKQPHLSTLCLHGNHPAAQQSWDELAATPTTHARVFLHSWQEQCALGLDFPWCAGPLLTPLRWRVIGPSAGLPHPI